MRMGTRASYLSHPSVAAVYPTEITHDNLLVNPLFMPNPTLVSAVESLGMGQVLVHGPHAIAARVDKEMAKGWGPELGAKLHPRDYSHPIPCVRQLWHLFQENKGQIAQDYELLTQGRLSAPAHESCTLIGDQIFIEPEAQVINCSLNSIDGPIYIGAQAQVLDGALLRGPVALGQGAVVNMGAKLRDATTIGPYCKVGGEVSNSIMTGYSNKGHDGFMGNSVLGHWCNLGADTNTSNLKNDYGNVSIYHIHSQQYMDTGTQFCGLFMGDHSKSGINTMFNTGTVVGVSANIFGGDFPPKFIPSFSWGGASGFVNYRIDKALEVAQRVMERRQLNLGPQEMALLKNLHQQSLSHPL
jgi:UDP-N-acetylglucosamine diphosphorylase/glucosamine-1-phosphate N-acetyltransferase